MCLKDAEQYYDVKLLAEEGLIIFDIDNIWTRIGYRDITYKRLQRIYRWLSATLQ